MKILLAEDDFATRKYMANFLSKYGSCDVTVDGMEAVDAFMLALEEEEPYDLVCLDIMMPVMDGYQALVGIRNIEKQYNIPEEKAVKVIMTTALNDEKNVKKAYDLVDAFANNPILKMYMTENAINKMVNSAKERIDAIHQSAIDKAHEDTNKFEDDAHYVANAYLEDTVDGWENVSEDQKNRSINALASFFNWMKAQADN